MLCTTLQTPYIKKNGGRSICVPAPFQYPENKCFRSTYFGLTHEIPQPIGLRTCRSRYVTPLGGIVPSHRSLSVERENWLSRCRTTNSKAGMYLHRQNKHTGVFNSANSNWSLLRKLQYLVFSKRINACPTLDASPSFLGCERGQGSMSVQLPRSDCKLKSKFSKNKKCQGAISNAFPP
jgi:hypothetical protein